MVTWNCVEGRTWGVCSEIWDCGAGEDKQGVQPKDWAVGSGGKVAGGCPEALVWCSGEGGPPDTWCGGARRI